MRLFRIILVFLLTININIQARTTLKFQDGKFKIVQFTDLHWIKGPDFEKANDSTISLMSRIIKLEHPDLVVITGDVVVSGAALEGWKEVIRPMTDAGIPFAVTFGNHDTETDITKEQALDFIRRSPYCLSYNANNKIDGVGNCALPILSSKGNKDKWILYLFDSHAYPKDTTLGAYDWIKNSQIQWYRKTSDYYSKKIGNVLPSFAFFHIPVPEFNAASQLPYIVGNKGEDVCSPNVNSGLVASFIEKKDILGIFVGHDHNNDFIVAPEGRICFAYGRKTGYNAAYHETLERGARVINLYEDGNRFDSYIRTLSGSSFNYTFKQKPDSCDHSSSESPLVHDNGEEAVPETITLKKTELFDKIKGGWAGKTIGCTYGGPVEFLYNGTMVQDYIPIGWNNDRVKWYFDNFPGLYDDIYVNLTFVDVFERLGLNAPTDAFATAFAHAPYPLWHANQAARYNLLHGIKPSDAGNWLNNPHADDIDYQIEADFAGLMSPGMPNTASDISDKVGHLICYGDGWYGGVFVGALYSLAFVSGNINLVVSEALKTLPQQSSFYQCISDIVNWHKAYPSDWKRTWFECQRKWSSENGCPDGVFTPFDIDAKLNSAYVVIGLLYGGGDFFKTIDIAARCGEDSDCNAATAGGILGTMLGYNNIPDFWKNSLIQVNDHNFIYTDISLNKIYDIGMKHALQVILQQGGKADNDQVSICCQRPKAVKYEKAFENHFPIEKISMNKDMSDQSRIDFEGTGIVVKGYVQCADSNYEALVDIFIDGKLYEKAQLPVSSSNKRRVDLFWKYQLSKMKHTITFKWLNFRSDAQVKLNEAIVYSNIPNNISY